MHLVTSNDSGDPNIHDVSLHKVDGRFCCSISVSAVSVSGVLGPFGHHYFGISIRLGIVVISVFSVSKVCYLLRGQRVFSCTCFCWGLVFFYSFRGFSPPSWIVFSLFFQVKVTSAIVFFSARVFTTQVFLDLKYVGYSLLVFERCDLSNVSFAFHVICLSLSLSLSLFFFFFFCVSLFFFVSIFLDSSRTLSLVCLLILAHFLIGFSCVEVPSCFIPTGGSSI